MTTRRAFIRSTGLLCCGIIGGSALFESCTPIKYVDGNLKNKIISIPRSEIEKGKFVIIRNSELEGPIYLAAENDHAFHASLMICTHNQCELKPTGSFLTCPCHGSEFSNTGKVLKEPAERDLQQYKVTSDISTIYIHLP